MHKEKTQRQLASAVAVLVMGSLIASAPAEAQSARKELMQ